MSFEKLYLDPYDFENLCRLGIREGLIEKTYDDKPINLKWVGNHRINNKSKLLTLLTLYDFIDGTSTLYGMELFKKENVIHPFSRLIDSMNKGYHLDESSKEMEVAVQSAVRLIRLNADKIATYIIKNWQILPYGFTSKDEVATQSETIGVINDLMNFDYDVLDGDNQFYHAIHHHLVIMRGKLIDSIYFSIVENASFTSSILKEQKNISIKEIQENREYIVSSKLHNELLLFPQPRTIKEAIELKNKKEMIRFRELLSEWSKSLMTGEITLEKKMRNDIKLANSELKISKKWKRYKETPFSFLFNAIGGHVPILSNIITVVDTLGKLHEKRVQQKHCWMSILNATPSNNV